MLVKLMFLKKICLIIYIGIALLFSSAGLRAQNNIQPFIDSLNQKIEQTKDYDAKKRRK